MVWSSQAAFASALVLGVEEVRTPKFEIRKKPEARNPKTGCPGAGCALLGLRISDFFRGSAIGFRI
jgi:hypothetical protein